MKAPFVVVFLSLLTISMGVHAGAALAAHPCSAAAPEGELVMMVYNVENLFDIDEVSLFDDYRQSPSPDVDAYDAERLLTKIENHSQLIVSCNGGRGPDILVLQELEVDFTPDPSFSLEDALVKYADFSLEELLSGGAVPDEVMGFPVEFFLIKRLRELGIDDYRFYEPRFDPSWQVRGIAHRCAFLSRFPAVQIRQHPLYQARDILEVTFDVHGHELTVFNNHWKSGASSVRTEPIRIQNAGVLRVLLEQRLVENPSADIVLAGDFNSHHNQDLRMDAPFGVTALNGVLGSQSREAALLRSEALLYNLWYELPQPERGSEVWMGQWGSLMQILLTPGLYDAQGVQYVDGSFRRHILPGENVDAVTGEPIRWVNLGPGAGYSDHLPVCANFRFARGSGSALERYHAHELGDEVEQHHEPIWVDFSLGAREIRDEVAALATLEPGALLAHIGERFQVDGLRTQRGVDIQGTHYDLFAPKPEVRDWLNSIREGQRFAFVGEFSIHRGRLQFVIQDLEWVIRPAAR